jgi:hypothetical protein
MMMAMKWINRLYIFFLGIILTITTGFGVAAFYPQPKQISYPMTPYKAILPESCYSTPKEQATAECQKAIRDQERNQQEELNRQQQFELEQRDYQNKNASYTRTAIFFGIVIGAFFAIIGIILIKPSKLIATGFLLASVSTAILTRFLINLASLGADIAGTGTPDSLAYIEFGMLLVLSVLVVIVGFFRLDRS